MFKRILWVSALSLAFSPAAMAGGDLMNGYVISNSDYMAPSQVGEITDPERYNDESTQCKFAQAAKRLREEREAAQAAAQPGAIVYGRQGVGSVL